MSCAFWPHGNVFFKLFIILFFFPEGGKSSIPGTAVPGTHQTPKIFVRCVSGFHSCWEILPTMSTAPDPAEPGAQNSSSPQIPQRSHKRGGVFVPLPANTDSLPRTWEKQKNSPALGKMVFSSTHGASLCDAGLRNPSTNTATLYSAVLGVI